jgi:Spx/MgsR family transcriptional regulator
MPLRLNQPARMNLGDAHMSRTHTITLYGIPNCDTVKKSRQWMAENGHEALFHNFKKQGVPESIEAWEKKVGWEALLNRKGTTWRKLDADVQARVTDANSALALMREQPSVIKRPVVVWGRGQVTVGFVPQQWAELA